MRKKILIAVLVAAFAVSGTVAGIVNYSDSEAKQQSKVTASQQTKESKNEVQNKEQKTEGLKSEDKIKINDKDAASRTSEKRISSSEKTAEPTKKNTTNSTPKNSASSKPAHQHRWENVYAERTVTKTKQVPYTKCYCCGADMTGNPSHIDQHLLNNESNVHYGTEYRTESYNVTEQYVKCQRCSCGATK